MLTLFTTPKPFKGHIAIIQRNAIRSWTLLKPACEIILFGDEEGAREAAEEMGVRHVSSLQRNDRGTPLLNDLFDQARRLASNEILGCINADIILMDDFVQAVRQVLSWRLRFLMVGQRRNLNIDRTLNFGPGWEERLKKQVDEEGEFYTGIDYFVFPRNLWGQIPPFAVGRFYWDNWLLYGARLRKAPVVDCSQAVTAVHQNHDYAHFSNHIEDAAKSSEARLNRELLGGARNCFTTFEATHQLTLQGIRSRCRGCYPVCVCMLGPT